jgi:hypothetical protein
VAKLGQPGLPDGICIFKPKIPIWVNFGGPCNGTPFGPFYNYLVYFMVIWYILWSFWYIYPVLVRCIKKIWQPWRCTVDLEHNVLIGMYFSETRSKILRRQKIKFVSKILYYFNDLHFPLFSMYFVFHPIFPCSQNWFPHFDFDRIGSTSLVESAYLMSEVCRHWVSFDLTCKLSR